MLRIIREPSNLNLIKSPALLISSRRQESSMISTQTTSGMLMKRVSCLRFHKAAPRRPTFPKSHSNIKPVDSSRSAKTGSLRLSVAIRVAGYLLLMSFFKGNAVGSSWKKMIPDKKAHVRCEEKGFSNEKHQLKWLSRTFIPQTALSQKTLSQRGTSSNRATRLLLLDGHSSPISFELFLTCWENHIIPLCIPPSTSHLLHPLDVGTLSKFTNIYTDELRNALQTGNLRISKDAFVPLWWVSRQDVMDPANIFTGWRNSGIWPVSKGIVYKRAGFDLPEARPFPNVTQLDAPITAEVFSTLLRQMDSSPPETAAQLREFLISCFDQQRRTGELFQEALSDLQQRAPELQ